VKRVVSFRVFIYVIPSCRSSLCVRSNTAGVGVAAEAGAEFSRFIKSLYWRLFQRWAGLWGLDGLFNPFGVIAFSRPDRLLEFYFGKIRHPPRPPRLVALFSLPWVLRCKIAYEFGTRFPILRELQVWLHVQFYATGLLLSKTITKAEL
jgi:hypothetical protein